jgi:hypothetical protein
MTARATGAALLTLVAIGYLFGDFEGGADFLIAVVVALLVGLGVTLWLERGERQGPPEVFDERATRRAVRRGVIRTALVAILWVFAGLFAVSIASTIWQTRGDREEHFESVVTYGFSAAHPGFRPATSTGCCPSGFRSTEVSMRVEPRSAEAVVTPVSLEFELDLRGRLDYDWSRNLPRTAVDLAAAGPDDRSALRTQLERLPEPIVATAVADLAQPLPLPRFYELLARHGLRYPDTTTIPVYLESSRGSQRHRGVHFDNRVSWPTPELAEFQAWVKRLRPSDDRVLDVLGLPDRERLRQLAAAPAVHGFILEQASPARLRSLLSDPAIRSLSVGDVAFKLGATS